MSPSSVTGATATCPRVFSPPEPSAGVGLALVPLRRLILIGLCWWAACCLPAGAALRLTLDDLSGPGFAARGIVLDWAEKGGKTHLSLASLRVGGVERGPLTLSCADARVVALRLECAAGQVERAAAQPVPVAFGLDFANGDFRVMLAPEAGEEWRLTGNWRQGETTLELAHAALERMAPWVPAMAAWQPKGRASGQLVLGRGKAGQRVALRLAVTGFSLGNQAGTVAMDKVSARIEGSAEQVADGSRQWQLALDWLGGEGYFAPMYLASGGVKLAMSGAWRDQRIQVGQGRLELAGVGGLDFSGEMGNDGSIPEARFSARGLNLAKLGELLLAPWLEQARLPKLRLGGGLDLAGNWHQGRLTALDVNLKGGMLDEPEDRFALSGLEVRLPWRLDAADTGEISFSGGRFQKLPIGAATLSIAMNGLDFQLGRTQIPILDGSLVLDQGRALRRNGAWQWEMAASIYPISMEQLTRSLGLPLMAGHLSANIPRIHSEGAGIVMDGMLVIQVFDGYLAVQGLSLTDPFGRAPVLRASKVDIRHLDLGQLTRTFSFGDITGFLDGDIEGLELVHWQPQRFNARFMSSPGDYPRRISQRAVQNISSLGGAGAGAAIQRSFLSMLESFGYKRIGLSCRLANGVCRMGGVAPAPQGYVLVEGGGIPALSVIGYNPAVDWDELLDRLKAAIAKNVRPVIR